VLNTSRLAAARQPGPVPQQRPRSSIARAVTFWVHRLPVCAAHPMSAAARPCASLTRELCIRDRGNKSMIRRRSVFDLAIISTNYLSLFVLID
jgi:hypothetical protein